ncbi:MAG: CBS domain-containing protein [Thermoleophilia bacterium]|nr:CBS domain-containing protein [Thermoleophilia bacterium]
MKTIRDVMTAGPTTVGASTPIADAARLMKSEDIGSLPILEDGKLAGVLTDRDIVLRVVAEGRDPQSTTAGEVGSHDPVTVDPQQNLDEALRLMAEHQVRRLPVVEEDGRLVGVLAQADVAREASPEQTGHVVEEISE